MGKRLLVSMKSYLGDAVMTQPLIEALERAGYELTLNTSKAAHAVLHTPTELGFRELSRPKTLRDILRKAKLLREESFDVALLVNRSFRAALVARLAGIPRRIGHPSEGRSPLLTDRVPYDESKFEAWSLLELARPLGVSADLVRPRLYVSDAERESGRARLEGATIGVQPGARYPLKQLPLEVTRRVASALQAQGHRIAFLGGPEESEDAAKLQASLQEPVVNLVGKTSIRETIGVLANLRSAFGSDTGLMHMAAASGCPVVQVFGPTPAVKWGHDYPPHRVLRADEGKMERASADEILKAVCDILRAS